MRKERTLYNEVRSEGWNSIFKVRTLLQGIDACGMCQKL